MTYDSDFGFGSPEEPEYTKKAKFNWKTLRFDHSVSKTAEFFDDCDGVTLDYKVRSKDYRRFDAKKLWQIYDKTKNLLKKQN